MKDKVTNGRESCQCPPVIWRSVLWAVCCKAIMLSRLFTNDTLHIVSVEIASECPGQMHLKAVKAALSVSQCVTPAIMTPLCYNCIIHLSFFQSIDGLHCHLLRHPCLSSALSLSVVICHIIPNDTACSSPKGL